MERTKITTGGASDEAGGRYRRALAAYVIAHGLANKPLPGFGFASRGLSVEAVSLETDLPVDDIGIEFNLGRRADVQAKRSLRLDGQLASALGQWRKAAMEGLDPDKNRVVIVGGHLSGSVLILRDLLVVLRADRMSLLTVQQQKVKRFLDRHLLGLSDDELSTLYACASIHEARLEEAEEEQSREMTLLLGTVFDLPETAHVILRDLVSQAAKRRIGQKISSWLTLLIDHGCALADDFKPSETLVWTAVLPQYVDALRRRGEFMHLLPLGASLPPISLQDCQSTFLASASGEDARDAGDLEWRLRRRGRCILTGLPGGGKSTALASVAAKIAVEGERLPMLVLLKDLGTEEEGGSFRQRLISAAVRRVNLSSTQTQLLRDELEWRLDNGGLVLLLDGLDETYERRNVMVHELYDFVETISPNVDILLSTRDVAYAAASTLGWKELRLNAPDNVDAIVSAVLGEGAKKYCDEAESAHDWISERRSWVKEALVKDKPLSDTPLFPILLSLLSIERAPGSLPTGRGQILETVVRSIVKRHAMQGKAFRVGGLFGEDAAAALHESFLIEAGQLGLGGGVISFTELLNAVSPYFSNVWGASPGTSTSMARSVIHFWDETGIFVISNDGSEVSPKIMLFAEIGDALNAISKCDEVGLLAWVTRSVNEGRNEPAVLAASLSPKAADALAEEVCKSSDQQVLSAGLRAMSESVLMSQERRKKLLFHEIRSVETPTLKNWSRWSALIDLDIPGDLRELALDELKLYPVQHQMLGRAYALLKWEHPSDLRERPEPLLEALAIEKLPKLASEAPQPWSTAVNVDRLQAKVIEQSADLLLGHVQEVVPLVMGAFEKGSFFTTSKLETLLSERGFSQELRAATEPTRKLLTKSMTDFAARYDAEAPLTFLRYLASSPVRAMKGRESVGLDELADLCETLNLNDLSAWPAKSQGISAHGKLIDLVIELGGFDRELLAAQAAYLLSREPDSESSEFFLLFDEARERGLSEWDSVNNKEEAAEALVGFLFWGRGMAYVASNALWDCSIPKIAAPLLREALPRLSSSADRLRIAALTLATLIEAPEILDWGVSENPYLREVVASILTINDDGEPPDLLCRLLNDADGWVRESAIGRLTQSGNRNARALLTMAAKSPNPNWKCRNCGASNDANKLVCDCRHSGPDPRRMAEEVLNRGKSTLSPRRSVMHFD